LRRVAPCLLCGLTKKIYLPDAHSADNVVDIVLTAMVVRLWIPSNLGPDRKSVIYKQPPAAQLLPPLMKILPENIQQATNTALELARTRGNRFKRTNADIALVAPTSSAIASLPQEGSAAVKPALEVAAAVSVSAPESRDKLWQSYRGLLSPQAFAAACLSAQRIENEFSSSFPNLYPEAMRSAYILLFAPKQLS
jgi:hypothetical protein